jgi:hypothetical protein
MSRFKSELRVIGPTAWVIAAILAIGGPAFLAWVAIPHDEDFDPWPIPGKILFAVVVSALMAVWVLLIGYVAGDARRRGMRYVMWTLLAFFIPNAIGFILYFIMRDPLLLSCPQCGAQVRQGFAFCHSCGASLGQACPSCRRAVEPAWSHCTGCGAALKP